MTINTPTNPHGFRPETSPRERVIALALSQVGLVEATGHNDGKAIEPFTGGRQEPWCAHFHAWLWREVGLPIPGDVIPTKACANPLASVAFTQRVFAEHGWILLGVSDIRPGDTVFYTSRGASDAGKGHHIGLCVSVSATHIVVVEGNESDGVKKVTRHKQSSYIWCVGRRPVEV